MERLRLGARRGRRSRYAPVRASCGFRRNVAATLPTRRERHGCSPDLGETLWYRFCSVSARVEIQNVAPEHRLRRQGHAEALGDALLDAAGVGNAVGGAVPGVGYDPE